MGRGRGRGASSSVAVRSGSSLAHVGCIADAAELMQLLNGGGTAGMQDGELGDSVYRLGKRVLGHLEAEKGTRYSGLGKAYRALRLQLGDQAKTVEGLSHAVAFQRHLTEFGEEAIFADIVGALALGRDGGDGPAEPEPDIEVQAQDDELAPARTRNGAQGEELRLNSDDPWALVRGRLPFPRTPQATLPRMREA